MKKSFVLYYDLDEVFAELEDEEAGQLIKAVFALRSGERLLILMTE